MSGPQTLVGRVEIWNALLLFDLPHNSCKSGNILKSCQKWTGLSGLSGFRGLYREGALFHHSLRLLEVTLFVDHDDAISIH